MRLKLESPSSATAMILSSRLTAKRIPNRQMGRAVVVEYTNKEEHLVVTHEMQAKGLYTVAMTDHDHRALDNHFIH